MKIDILDTQFQHLLSTYHAKELAWGSLHIALEDGNLEDSHIDFCINYAIETNDKDGLMLASVLRRLSLEDREILYRRL